jgi:RimJ/RimL family protein N-acetyltransferase
VSEHRHPQTGQPIGAPVDDTPAQRPGPVTLAGRYGRVERLNEQHAASLWRELEGHDTVWTYMSQYGPFTGADEFSAWVKSRIALQDPYSYAIVYSPALQRSPLGTEAQYLLARYAFERLGYRRYEWKCHSHNAASRRAALRYGFTFEGILRQQMIAKGRNRDTVMFSMLDSEWPARKANFERWLAPGNFGADGRQIESLSRLTGTQ